jgi:hypothetical protein
MDLSYDERAKKIPAGCPAGEGGMVEEIYIHYYRHLVQEKVTPFWNIFPRNCSGGAFFSLRRHAEGVKTVYLNL